MTRRDWLRVGDIVPADVELLDGALEVDQSALTGESLPVDRKPGERTFSSAVVRRGEAGAKVTATGPRTYFGKTAKLVEEAEVREEPPCLAEAGDEGEDFGAQHRGDR